MERRDGPALHHASLTELGGQPPVEALKTAFFVPIASSLLLVSLPQALSEVYTTKRRRVPCLPLPPSLPQAT